MFHLNLSWVVNKLFFWFSNNKQIETYYFRKCWLFQIFKNYDFSKNVIVSKNIFSKYLFVTRKRFLGLANDSEDSRTVLSIRERYLWIALSRIETYFEIFHQQTQIFDFPATKNRNILFRKCCFFQIFGKMWFFHHSRTILRTREGYWVLANAISELIWAV